MIPKHDLKYDVLCDIDAPYPKEYDGCNVRINWECPKCEGLYHCHVPPELTVTEDIFDYALDQCHEHADCSMTDKLEYRNCEITELFTI